MRIFLLFGLLSTLLAVAEQPNILWLTSEDHGPHLGCYGDSYAVTPNLDAFAKRSLLYTRASSNAPICAPARTTLITGMYAPALGAHHMRSAVPIPPWLKLYPELLREKGYYCTNNSKTDYNLADNDAAVWDQCSGKAHYRNRPPGTPFFAIFNATMTHESQIRNENSDPLHDPARAPIPPYHPDTPEVRKDWAQYYDRITQMDGWFQKQLDELEEAGLADSTIVFFYADHGSGMPRSKRYAGWSGLHVPLLVHIPEKFKHLRPPGYMAGGRTDRLVGFVDMAPTLLSLIGEEPAPYHQGRAFLGEHFVAAPESSIGFVGRADERPDETRSVTDGRYIYLRNFMPHVPLLKGLEYQMETPTTRIWERLHREKQLNPVQSAAWSAPRPVEELYDLQVDPHETHNLAASRPELLGPFRSALLQHFIETRDLGLLPESLFHELSRQADQTPGDFAKSSHYDPEELWPSASTRTPDEPVTLELADPQALALKLRGMLPHSTGILQASPDLAAQLGPLLTADSPEIRAAAAELLTHHPADREKAIAVLLDLADPAASDPFASLHALDALSRLDRLEPDQLAKLRQTNTTPGPEWPDRVAGYSQRLLPTVTRQFSNSNP